MITFKPKMKNTKGEGGGGRIGLVSVNTKLRYTYWGESVEKGRYKQLGGKEKQ